MRLLFQARCSLFPEVLPMTIEFTGRNTTCGVKCRQLAEQELGRIGEMLDSGASAHVILTEDKYRKIAEVNVTASHETLSATCEGTDIHQALHEAIRKIEQQVVKHKERRLSVERHAKPENAAPLVEVPGV